MRARRDPDGSEEFLRPVQAEYLSRLPGQTSEFAALWLQARAGDQAALDRLRDGVHRIAGNAGTLGFPDLSRVARSAELALEHGGPTTEAESAIQSLFETMRATQ
ncbi:MAG: Hpt domain-containing protein [Dehalococcoidia bacterium]